MPPRKPAQTPAQGTDTAADMSVEAVDAPNGHTNGTGQSMPASEAARLLAAMQVVDVYSVLDTPKNASEDPRTVRELLSSKKPPSTDVVFNTFVAAVTSAANTLTKPEALENLRGFAAVFLPRLSSCDRSKPDIPDPPHYVLHRTMNNGLDIFSTMASGDLPHETITEIGNLRDTDLLAIHPSARQAAQPLRLETLSRPHKLPIPTLPPYPSRPRISPATRFLYYGPFSSFSPSYDSTGTSESYSHSLSRKVARDQIERRKDDITQVDPALPLPNPHTLDGKDNNNDKEGDENDDEDGLLAKEKVDNHLSVGTDLIVRLQKKQWKRLKSHASILDNSSQSSLATASDIPDDSERVLANELLEYLTSMIQKSAISTTTSTKRPPSLSSIPSSSHLHKVRRRLLQPSEDTYYGILDPTNSRAVQESFLNAPPQRR